MAASRIGARAARATSAFAWVTIAWTASAHAQLGAQPHGDLPAEEPAPPPAPKLTRPPALIKSVDPIYPPEALAEKLAADVTLLIDIDTDGHVSGVQVSQPAGHGFDEAAVAAANEMEFSPAEIDGKPGKIRIEYVMHFVPQVVATPPPEAPPPAPPPAATSAAAAPVIVRGRLREKGTRDPIAGADVAVIRNAPGAPDAANGRAAVVTITDGEGRFEVRGPAPGGLRVIVSDTEHEPCIHDFSAREIGGAVVPQINCFARPRDVRYETHVRAQRQHEEVTRHTLSKDELTTVPGTFGDPLRVIQNLPGVARIPYGVGQLVVRGAAPQDSSVFIDGQRVPILFHFLGGPSVLTPNLIDKIDFYPGGFGVHYGRATAGILDVTTNSEPASHLHGNADINLLDSSGYIEGPIAGGVSGGLAARRSYIDLLLPFVVPEQQGSTTVVATPVYWDYQVRASKDIEGAGRISVSAFGSDDTLHVVSSDPARANLDLGTHIGFHRLVTTWNTSAHGWTSKLSPSYGFDTSRFDAGVVGVDFGAQVFSLREDLSRRLSDRLTLLAGFDGTLRLEELHFHIPIPNSLTRTFGRIQPQITTVDRAFADMGNAVYLEGLWDVGRGLRLVPGLRGDWFHYNRTDRYTYDPRLVAHWELTPAWALKAGVGIFHQPQQPQILDSLYGNPNLKAIWSDAYHLGFERRFTDVITLDTTFYFLRRHNLPVPERAVNFSDQGRGRAYGMELLLRHEITRRFFGWISYTLSRSEQTDRSVGNFDAGGMMGAIPGQSPSTFYPTAFDQTHNFILVASYRLKAWELGTRYRVVTGIPQTPIVGSVFDSDYNTYRPVQGPLNSTRRQTFHQLDLRVERTWTYDTWRFSIYLDVQNVYNAQNPEFTIYDYRYRQAAPVRGLPILPILGFRGKF